MSPIERNPELPDPLRPSRETMRETLVERQIREAMEAGAFDDLPHQGAGLPLEDDSAAGDWALDWLAHFAIPAVRWWDDIVFN